MLFIIALMNAAAGLFFLAFWLSLHKFVNTELATNDIHINITKWPAKCSAVLSFEKQNLNIKLNQTTRGPLDTASNKRSIRPTEHSENTHTHAHLHRIFDKLFDVFCFSRGLLNVQKSTKRKQRKPKINEMN